ncbi:hypothetical protein QWY77_00895 [Thalassotalea ponticola]|uniref:hypothetical protein n=1 Tax=Thalassotalea ponticola TaxID=1523392 RepID=UPI0025B5769F|nr:hypothetical protein [Thalassotalea ponticola]MDN3651342.1 hypothetical protein [Thalassotalea ponticola]
MSQIHEAQYRLERERRQRIAEDRVRNTTSDYLERYQHVLSILRQQGLSEFVQEQYDRSLVELQQIRRELDSDPFTAREHSQLLASEIYSLPSIARRIKKQVEEAQYQQYLKDREARVEAEKQKNARIAACWTQEMCDWDDKLSLNLMIEEIKALEHEVFSENSIDTEGELTSRFLALKKQGCKKAEERRADMKKQAQPSVNKHLAGVISDMALKNLPDGQAQEITKQLDDICLENCENPVKQLEKIERVSYQADKKIEDESVRKETVKAIFNTLKNSGFSVQKPKLVVTKTGDKEVVISASRPAGNRAQFLIRLDGSCTYKFDNYKGQTCKKDIDTVLPKLSEIYGVDLSDSRVLWSNPDDEDSEMKPIPSQTKNEQG